MKSNAANIYWENRIKTASPMELVIIAYEAAITSLEAAKSKMEGKKIVDSGLLIIKAQKIIRELRNSLNLDVKEISANLFFLYRFMDQQLISASRNKDVILLDRVIRMLSELKGAWLIAAKNVPQQQPAACAESPAFMNAYK